MDNMPMDNGVVVNPTGGEVGFSHRENYSGAHQPIMDASQSSGVTPQVLVLLLVCAIKRNWKWAFFFSLVLSSLGAAATWLFFPVKYEASSWVFAFSQVPYTVFQTPEGRGDYENFLATQFALIKSERLLEEVLKDERLAQVTELHKQKDPVRWLQKNITVSRQGKSEYFTISFADTNPDDALAVTAAVTKAYMDRYMNEVENRDTKLTGDLVLEKTNFESQVRLQQKQIQQLMRDAAGKGADLAGGIMQQESILRDYLLEDAKLQAMTARYEAAKGFNPDVQEIPQLLINKAIRDDPTVAFYRAQVDSLTAKIDARSKMVTADDPSLRELNTRLQEAKADLEELEKTLVMAKQRDLQEELKVRAQENVWAMEAEIKSQTALVAILNEKVKQQKSVAQDRTDDTATIEFLKLRLDRDNQTLDKLSERVTALATEARSAARVILDREARRPTSPKVALKFPLTIMVGLGLFVVPFVLGIALEMMKPRLYHVSQVRKAAPEILIGEIMEPPVAWLHGNTFRKRLAKYRETVHNWCTHLLLADPFRRYQTMAIASVAGDDGKTFLAIQIATAMAQMKSGPVLLIDGDMRVGRLHLLFGNEEPGPGLADVLSFRKGIGEAIVMNEREPNLHLLSAGNLDISPYELLGDGRFRELLDTLGEHYSMILVVVPPVANAAESLIMASSVDSVLLCVRQGETVLAAMEDAFRKLVNTGSHVDGIVVKDIPYSHMAGKDGGFSDKIEQIRLAHLLKQADAY